MKTISENTECRECNCSLDCINRNDIMCLAAERLGKELKIDNQQRRAEGG